MSSNKSSKWSSSSSLSKLVSRISRTLSFTSKKSQQTFKNNKKVKPAETVVKNVNFVPQSAPVVRRHPLPPISNVIYAANPDKEQAHRHLVYQNMYVADHIEEEDDDDEHYRYSLRPNLSLFNISVDNIHSLSQASSPLQHDWLDDIFHSTKIEDK